jgi:hypothetical protein
MNKSTCMIFLDIVPLLGVNRPSRHQVLPVEMFISLASVLSTLAFKIVIGWTIFPLTDPIECACRFTIYRVKEIGNLGDLDREPLFGNVHVKHYPGGSL